MYGTQTDEDYIQLRFQFENDVKMYGTQTSNMATCIQNGLRMM